jgi:hypothetical protein
VDSLDRPSDKPGFSSHDIQCPVCFGTGTTIGASDREVDLACKMCGHEWTVERQQPLTPYNPPE